MTQFWVGGYGADMEGDAAGIGVLSGDEGREPTTLAYRGTAVKTASPSWLAAHPTRDIVYAALEGAGQVQAFMRSGERTLRALGAPVDAGEVVCHLAVAPDGSALIASCYGDGRVVRVGLHAGGGVGAARVAEAAEDPYAPGNTSPATDASSSAEDEVLRTLAEVAGAGDGAESAFADFLAAQRAETAGFDIDAVLRGEGAHILGRAADAVSPEKAGASAAAPPERRSHAHAAAFLPDGRIATTDLGFDLVRIWRYSSSGLRLDHEVVLPYGVGPRHMVVHPSGHLHVVTEYSCEVFTLAPGADGCWRLVAATTVASVAQVGADFPAELARSRDGATLYTALRGSNTIAALRVRGAGETVEPLALADSGVDWPRHHLVHEGALLVAGQRSGNIAVLDLDDRTGAPRSVRHRAPVPAPTHLLLAR